jgi:endonuclease YncB( thermonuclease family)
VAQRKSELPVSDDWPRAAEERWHGVLALVVFLVLGAGIALLLRLPAEIDLAGVGGLVDRMTTSAYAPAPQTGFRADVAPRPMPVCGTGRRVNCVVDGDTLWLNGEKIRIVNIDAPEVRGRCAAEKRHAAEATKALVRLVSNAPLRLAREGRDRYGRTLAAIVTPRGNVGDMLVRLDLAARWRGHREPAGTWCGA